MIYRRTLLAAGAGVAVLAPVGLALDASADEVPTEAGQPVPATMNAANNSTAAAPKVPLSHTSADAARDTSTRNGS
jgi:hypothetical protein